MGIEASPDDGPVEYQGRPSLALMANAIGEMHRTEKGHIEVLVCSDGGRSLR